MQKDAPGIKSIPLLQAIISHNFI